jgi:hypothetical protein
VRSTVAGVESGGWFPLSGMFLARIHDREKESFYESLFRLEKPHKSKENGRSQTKNPLALAGAH